MDAQTALPVERLVAITDGLHFGIMGVAREALRQAGIKFAPSGDLVDNTEMGDRAIRQIEEALDGVSTASRQLEAAVLEYYNADY